MSAPSREAEIAVALENFWHNISHDDLQALETYFIGTLEYNGTPITKDNFETLFDRWSETLTLEDLENIL